MQKYEWERLKTILIDLLIVAIFGFILGFYTYKFEDIILYNL